MDGASSMEVFIITHLARLWPWKAPVLLLSAILSQPSPCAWLFTAFPLFFTGSMSAVWMRMWEGESINFSAVLQIFTIPFRCLFHIPLSFIHAGRIQQLN